MLYSRFQVTAVLFGLGALASPIFAADPATVRGPADVKTQPLAAVWQYSRDGGKSFAKDPPAGVPGGTEKATFPLVVRGTFQVADPQKLAGLWVRIGEAGSSAPGAICDGDLNEASGGYWKDLGFIPTLLNARVMINGKPVETVHGPMLYHWKPLIGDIRASENTIEISGDCYTPWPVAAPPQAITAELASAAPQPVAIYNGPLLGDFGDGYFTLACRTPLAADVTVEATPLDPAGQPVSITSSHKLWHRIKVPVPAGTKSVSYRLKAKLGEHETKRGPFTMTFPGDTFRFVALGNVKAHVEGIEHWQRVARHALAAKPAFIAHTGNCEEQGPWDFGWQSQYFDPAGDLLATVPTLLTPCDRDFAGAVQELHYTPAANTYSHTWSKQIGPLRLIGLDGNQEWKPGSENTQWLEKELSAAKEKYVIVLDGYPGYTSGRNSRKLFPALLQTRNVILPLLAKYHASLMLCGHDPDYERCEPTPDKGVTQIVTGAAGKDAYRFSGRAMANNPFGSGKGHDWAGAEQMLSFLIFNVRPDAMEMQCVTPPAAEGGEVRVLDKKTFKPRPSP
ncbi:MAG: hypothetical protein K8T25_23635 [Planctomycetia bacterium]|nr:hypothetical protein [Planctomycetia bacterium]